MQLLQITPAVFDETNPCSFPVSGPNGRRIPRAEVVGEVLELPGGVHPLAILAAEGGALTLGASGRTFIEGLELHYAGVIERAARHGVENVEAVEADAGIRQV